MTFESPWDLSSIVPLLMEFRHERDWEQFHRPKELTAAISIEAAELQVETTEKAFQIIYRKYDQGQAGLIEYIDARTAMTNAKENLIVAKYDYLISYAGYERAAGLYQFRKTD